MTQSVCASDIPTTSSSSSISSLLRYIGDYLTRYDFRGQKKIEEDGLAVTIILWLGLCVLFCYIGTVLCARPVVLS